MIDYKGGTITWDNSHKWEEDDQWYDYNQDILQVSYGKNCVIDVGNYPQRPETGTINRQFVIIVIDYSSYPEDDDKSDAWSYPYASIPCKDKLDLLTQLQRAIDVYPTMIG